MSYLNKWYIYQKERFPVLIYGLYVFCIVFAVFCYTSYICNNMVETQQENLKQYIYKSEEITNFGDTEIYKIKYGTLIPMFLVTFLQFLMVRIVDEFKDYEEDCKYRPYRPVPRGLISLKELKILFVICVVLQFFITLLSNPDGLIYLFLIWIIFAIMSKGFFIKNTLDKHILLEVLLDEIIIPVMVLFLSTFLFKDFLKFVGDNSTVSYNGIFINFKSLIPILLISYLISWIVEIARKIRCKEDEENGVKTYTAIFGIKKAILLLWGLEIVLMVINIILFKNIYFYAILLGIVSIINILFMIKQNKTLAKTTEISANVYIILTYLSMIVLI